MSDLLARPIVPVASPDDGTATAKAIGEYLTGVGDLTLLYVVEKGGGGIDKASVEQREEHAEKSFEAFRGALSGVDGAFDVTTEIGYATDVADGILDAARSHDASAIVFTSRAGGSILDVFSTGDVSDELLQNDEFPVLALPGPEEGAGS